MNQTPVESKPMLPTSNSNSNSILNVKSKNNSSRTNSLTSSARVKILKLPNALAKDGGGGLRFEDPRYKAAKLKKQRKQDIQRRFNDSGQNVASKNTSKRSNEPSSELQNNYRVAHCHMTFIFDPNGRFSYWMGIYIVLYAFYIVYFQSFLSISFQVRSIANLNITGKVICLNLFFEP